MAKTKGRSGCGRGGKKLPKSTGKPKKLPPKPWKNA